METPITKKRLRIEKRCNAVKVTTDTNKTTSPTGYKIARKTSKLDPEMLVIAGLIKKADRIVVHPKAMIMVSSTSSDLLETLIRIALANPKSANG